MSIHVPPAGPQDTAALAAALQRSRAEAPVESPPPPQANAVEGATFDVLPSRPPTDLLKEIEAAGRRWDELRAQRRELHFTHDPHQNRVVVEVRDLEGNVLRTIPPSTALDVIAGGPLG